MWGEGWRGIFSINALFCILLHSIARKIRRPYFGSLAETPPSSPTITVGAASQWWSNERMMVYFKIMMVKCLLMMVNCLFKMVKCLSMMVKWVYVHKLILPSLTGISPSLTSISPSLTSILPSLSWSKPSFAHLTIIEKLHQLYWCWVL